MNKEKIENKEHIVAYTLSALAKEQLIATKEAEKAIKKFYLKKTAKVNSL